MPWQRRNGSVESHWIFSWRAECGCFDLIHKSLDLLGRKDRALRSNLAQRHRGRRCLELTRILGSCNTPIPFVSVTMSSIHLTPYHAQGPLEPVAWPVTRLWAASCFLACEHASGGDLVGNDTEKISIPPAWHCTKSVQCTYWLRSYQQISATCSTPNSESP